MPTARENLLKASGDDDDSNLVEYLISKQDAKSQPVNVAETFLELNRGQQKRLLRRLSNVVDKQLSVLLSPSSSSDSNVKDSLAIVLGIVSVLASILKTEDILIEDLLPLLRSLHGALVVLPDKTGLLKDRICHLCECWWTYKLEDRHSLISNCFIYLMQRSCGKDSVKRNVKRVWALKECLSVIDLHDEVYSLLKTCAVSSLYLQVVEGQKFIAFLLNLNENFIDGFHHEIKLKLVQCTSDEAVHYGEIYYRAWLTCNNDALKKKLEENCIQDLIHHAVYASSKKLFTTLHKVLGYFHAHRSQRQVDEMLWRLYKPILWRSLKVPNPSVRINAASLFFSLFPLQDPSAKRVDADDELQRQFNLIEELLYDPYPDLRSVAVFNLCTVCSMYWEMIPASVIKSMLMHLINDLAFDAASVAVRMSVFKAFSVLVQNPVSHPFLKAVLPDVGKCFHDVSESVRLSFVEMLMTLKGLKTIKFWDIVSIQELMERLVVDTPAVGRRIVSLVFGGFHPTTKGKKELLLRSIDLISTNRAASRCFYFHAHHFLDHDGIVNYMLLVCRFLWCHANAEIKRAVKAGELEEAVWEDPHSEDNELEGSVGVEANVSLTADVISGLIDAVCILWTRIKSALSKEHGKKLVVCYSKTIPKLYRILKNSDVAPSLMYLSSFLPASHVSMSVSRCMSNLRSLPSDCYSDNYKILLACMCNWGRAGDVLELIKDWLKAGLADGSNTPASTKLKRNGKKMVRFREPQEPHPDLAIEFLTFMLQDATCRNILLTCERKVLITYVDLLHRVQKTLQRQLCANVDCCVNTEFSCSLLLVMCKLCVILHDKNNKPTFNGIRTFSALLGWTEEVVLPKLLEMGTGQNGTSNGSRSSQNAGVNSSRRSSHLKRNSDQRSLDLTSGSVASTVVQTALCTASNTIMVGVVDFNLSAQIANFCGAVLALVAQCQTGNGHKMIAEVVQVIPKLQEYGFVTNGAQIIYKTTVPTLIGSVVKSVVSHSKKFPDDRTKLFLSIKCPIMDVFKNYESYLSKDCDALRDVVCTFMATIINDIAEHIEDQTGTDVDNITEIEKLPPAACVLFTIIVSTAVVLRHFTRELIACLKSRAIQDPFGLSAISVMFLLIHKHQVPASDVKEGVLLLEDLIHIAENEQNNNSTDEQFKDKIHNVMELLVNVKKSVGIA